MTVIKRRVRVTAPNWPQLNTGLHPDVKKAFANLQQEILVAMARGSIKEADVYSKLSLLLHHTEQDFDELLTLYKKPLPAATEQEHKEKITTYIITQRESD